MLDKYGVEGDGLFEKIRDEVRESPLFRFDWFFLSRTPVEISRRCTTLLNTVAKEFEPDTKDTKETKANGEGKGRGRARDEDEENDDAAPAKKKSKNGTTVSSRIVAMAAEHLI
jgi:SWI/SNF-related matrix-associated actin-dependent regulator of chromatin subfamily A member 5